jgi:hypothetical protein
VVLLRASSEELGDAVDLRATVGEGNGDGGLPHGELLARFAEAATRGSDDLDDVRAALLAAVGPAAFVEAAATAGIFNGLVRVADATGIPLDDGTLAASVDLRGDLGLNDYAGASSSDLRRASGEQTRDVTRLFS